MHDVVIIGGGPAGLATAYSLENSGMDVLLYEESDRLGGRAQTEYVGGEPVNTGAMFIYRNTPSHALADELGVELVPFTPDTFGINLGETTVVSRDNSDLVTRLPLSDESKAVLDEYMARALSDYRSNTNEGNLLDASKSLAQESAAAQLESLPEEVASIIESAIHGGSVAPPEKLSAQYALRYFASYIAHEKNNRLVAVEGMQEIPDRLAARLTSTQVVMNTEVTRVTPTKDGAAWTVETRHGGETAITSAQHVVIAIPAPRIERIVDLPSWKREALAKVDTPGSTTLGVVADLPDPSTSYKSAGLVTETYNDWAFVATPGKRFDAIINPRPGRSDGVLQFTCFGNSAGYIAEAAQQDQKTTDEWLEDFYAVAPGLRGKVRGVFIQSWPHCFSLLTPTRLTVIDQLRAPVHHTLHFAGDYCSDTAGTHGAYAEAERVAQTILSR